NSIQIFFLVLVDDRIALIIVALANKPRKDPGRVGGIGNTALGGLAVERADVVAGNRTPVSIRGVVQFGPALDACKEAFIPRPVSRHAIPIPLLLEAEPVRIDDGNQVFGARKDIDIGFLVVEILRESSVSAAGDARIPDAPTVAVRPVPGAGIVGEREGGSETRPPKAEGERDRERTGSRHRVRPELLADPLDRTSAFGE